MSSLRKSTEIFSRATLKAVKPVVVYADPDLTQEIEHIDWQMIPPGESTSRTVYILSRSNVDITLSMTTKYWVPLVSADFISLSWDGEGKVLSPGQSVSAVLTLTVSPDIREITEFGFTITITGSG